MKSPVIKRSIMLGGHKTSVSLEDAFWEGVKDIAQGRRMSGSALIGAIDAQRTDGNLSSAIRLFVLDHYRTLAQSKAAECSVREDEKPDAAPRVFRGSESVRPPGFRRWA